MPRSCIGKVFAVVLATPQTAQKIAYMRGSDSDDIEPQNAITHQIAPIRHAQYTQLNSAIGDTTQRKPTARCATLQKCLGTRTNS